MMVHGTTDYVYIPLVRYRNNGIIKLTNNFILFFVTVLSPVLWANVLFLTQCYPHDIITMVIL